MSGPDVDPVEGQDEVLAELVRLATAERDGTIPSVMIHFGPATAYTVVALLQLAWRNPGLSPKQKQLAEDVGRQLQQAFREPLWSSLEAGWDTGQDVAADLAAIAAADPAGPAAAAPAGPPDPVPDGARWPGQGLTRDQADALMAWVYRFEMARAAEAWNTKTIISWIAESTGLDVEEVEPLFDWPTLAQVRSAVEAAVRGSGFLSAEQPEEPGLANAWVVISPDGRLVWYPLTETAEVETLVSGAYAPGALDRAFVAGPLRVLASDVALIAPDHYPPNPLARKMITALSGGQITQYWRGHVALVQYEQASDSGEWLWPGPMSPEWARRVTEAAQ